MATKVTEFTIEPTEPGWYVARLRDGPTKEFVTGWQVVFIEDVDDLGLYVNHWDSRLDCETSSWEFRERLIID